MEQKNRKFAITISVDAEGYDMLTKLALVRGSSKSEVVRTMIEDYFKKLVKKGNL